MTDECVMYAGTIGLELVTKERLEQIDKHGRTIELDQANNDTGQLIQAAKTLLGDVNTRAYANVPYKWDKKWWERMINKDYKERLIIAAALIVAEIDRISYKTKVDNPKANV